MAPREEREKLAPAAMAPAAAELMRAEGTANQLAWRESLKRMSEAEADDPSRALAAYKRFFVERTMSPELGVEVGLKIAQLRSKLGDNAGALQTCEVLAAKYADEPTAVLLSLQKARVLMEGKQLAQASECVNEAMPELVALGPSRYREISDLLLKLVQANLDSGDADGKERAKALCVGVEEVYLRWLKGGTLPHTWQMFEALQAKYQQAGEQKRAEELLPKAIDVLLQAKATPQNPEGADVSIEAARWMIRNGSNEEADLLYDKATKYGNAFGNSMVMLDQANNSLNAGKTEEGSQLLQRLIPISSGRIKLISQVWLGNALYDRGDLEGVKKVLAPLLSKADLYQEGEDVSFYLQAKDTYSRADKWIMHPIQADVKEVNFTGSSETDQPLYTRFRIRVYGGMPLSIAVDSPLITANVLSIDEWKNGTSRFAEEEKEVIIKSYSNIQYHNIPIVISSGKNKNVLTVYVSLTRNEQESIIQ